MTIVSINDLPVRSTRKQGSGRTYPVTTPLAAIMQSLGWRINKLALVVDINEDVLGLYVRGRKRIAGHHIDIISSTLGVSAADIDYIPPDEDLPRRIDYDGLISEVWNILVETHDPQAALDFAWENSSTSCRPLSKSAVRLLHTLLCAWEEGSVPGVFDTALASLRDRFIANL